VLTHDCSFVDMTQKLSCRYSLTNPRDAKACKNGSVRRAYNVVADNTVLSSFA